MALVNVGSLSDFWVGEIRGLELHGRRVVLLRTAQGVSAYEDKCPHLGFALSKGKLEGNCLTCAAHAWQFDVDCGRGINPSNARLSRYPVEIRDEEIWIGLSPQPAET